MVVQNIASNVRQRMDAASQAYRGLWQTYRDTQRQAVIIVARNGRSVANTEVGAAKNIYTSARAAFERARADGVREIARHPRHYVPAGRKQMTAAYRATLDLLNKTRGELSDVATDSYRRMSAQLSAAPAAPVAGEEETRATQADDANTVEQTAEPKTATKAAPRKKASSRTSTETGTTTTAKKPRARRTKASSSSSTSS